MKRLAILLALILPCAAFAQSVGSTSAVQTSNASQSGAMNAGVQASITTNGVKPDWFGMNLGTTYTSPGANSSAFSTFNCAGIGGDSTTIGPFSHADAKPITEADCPHVRTAVTTMQIAAFVRPFDPSKSMHITNAALGMLCNTSDGESLRREGQCPADDKRAEAPITAAPRFKVGQASPADLVAMYSGQ